MTKSPADALAREEAVHTLDRNLCVTAGAGAGKTSLLIERILYAVLAKEIRLSEIAAITFTEKAAAELRDRLESSLEQVIERLGKQSDLSRGDEAQRTLQRLEPLQIDSATVQQRAKQALQAQAVLETIHGFAGRILRRWPTRVELSHDFEIDDGTRWHHHVRQRWPQFAEDALRNQAHGASWHRVLRWLRLEEVRSVAEQLADYPDDPSLHAKRDFFEILRPKLEHLHQKLSQDLAHLISPRSQKFPELLNAHCEALALVLEHGPNNFAEALHQRKLLTCLESTPIAPPSSCSGIDAALCHGRLKESHRFLRDLRRTDESLAGDLLQVTQPIAKRLQESFALSGLMTFDGLLRRCRNLLLQDLEVRRQEGERISLLLLDEFQDTDPLQCEIAFLLCEASIETPARDPWQTLLAPGKLFLVGDPKQSIYRFRGADLETYHRAVDHVLTQGGKQLSLTVSFRSPPGIVEPINLLFSRFLGPRSRSEPNYEPMVSYAEKHDTEAKVEIWRIRPDSPGEKLRMSQGRRAEGNAIAARIKQWVSQGVPRSDVAVLLWSLNNLSLYLRPLRQAGIPCIVEGGSTFIERTEVNELLALLMAAADPQDRVAFLGALRSSLYAVTDPDIARFANCSESFTWLAALDPKHPAPVREAAMHLRDLHTRLKTEPTFEVINALVEETPLLTIAASAFEGAERIANIRKLTALAQERVTRLGLPLAEALREIVRSLETTQGESESSLADEQVDAVRILTIHKAKGLEFERVIVPDLGREEREPPEQFVKVAAYRHEDGTFPAVDVPRAGLLNLAMVSHKERNREHRLAESKRLLYVALTRARQKLVVVHHDTPLRSGQAWLQALKSWGYETDAWQNDNALALAGGQVRYQEISEQAMLRLLRSTPEDPSKQLVDAVATCQQAIRHVKETRPRFQQPSSLEPETSSPFEGRSQTRRNLSRVVGIACHRFLQVSSPKAVRSTQLREIVRSVAQEENVPESTLRPRVEEILWNKELSSLWTWLENADVLGRELPLLMRVGNTVWRGSADLVYRHKGEVVVADYKTDQTDDLNLLRERYSGQLSLYGSALETAWRLPTKPRLELWLLRFGKRLSLPHSSPGGPPPNQASSR